MIKLFSRVFFIVFFLFVAVLFLSPLSAVFVEFFRMQPALDGISEMSEYSFATFYSLFWQIFASYALSVFKSGFFKALAYSLFITIFSTWIIITFSSMTTWMLMRLKNKFNSLIYSCFIFSLLVPYPLLMWTSPKTAAIFHLANPFGMLILYLGLGAGMTMFLYGVFIRQIPKEIEEAAFMDGCSVRAVFFNITMPILSPVTSLAIVLNALYLWNDYLMPSLILGGQYKTIPMLIQSLSANPQGKTALIAVLIISLAMPVLFFAMFRKSIIKAASVGILK